MIGKIVAAYLGSKAAKETSALGGSTGAALGVAATALISRMSLPALAAVTAGGYLAKKLAAKGKQTPARAPATDTTGRTGTEFKAVA